MATVSSPRPTSPQPETTSPRPGVTGGVQRKVLLGLTGEVSDRIDDLTARTGYELGELFDVAMMLMKLSLDAVEDGKLVGIAAEGQELEQEFKGFHKNDPIA